jgi:hypothetical protein
MRPTDAICESLDEGSEPELEKYPKNIASKFGKSCP